MYRVLLSVVLTLGCVPSAFAAAEVQKAISAGLETPLGSVGVSFSGNATTGNRIVGVAVFGAEEPDLADLSCNDATNGTYTDDVVNAFSSKTVFICSKCNITGGFTQVNFVNAGTTGNGVFAIYEVSGTGCSTVQVESQDNASDTSHECASAGLSGTGAAFCGAQLGAGNAPTAGGAWTEHTSPSDPRFFQYQYGTLASDQGPFTTSMAEDAAAAMAFYPDAAVSGNKRRMQLGVGE